MSPGFYDERSMKVKLTEYAEEQYGIAKLPEDAAYAMAYVPFQQERFKAYSPEQGYMLGTMFQELNKPFCGGKCGEAND